MPEIYHKTKGIIKVRRLPKPKAPTPAPAPSPLPENSLPQRIWKDFQRCMKVLGSVRCYLVLQYLATIRTWVTATHINTVAGISYENHATARTMLKRWTKCGILIQRQNPHPKARRSYVYTLSPLSCKLLGVPPITDEPQPSSNP